MFLKYILIFSSCLLEGLLFKRPKDINEIIIKFLSKFNGLFSPKENIYPNKFSFIFNSTYPNLRYFYHPKRKTLLSICISRVTGPIKDMDSFLDSCSANSTHNMLLNSLTLCFRVSLRSSAMLVRIFTIHLGCLISQRLSQFSQFLFTLCLGS